MGRRANPYWKIKERHMNREEERFCLDCDGPMVFLDADWESGRGWRAQWECPACLAALKARKEDEDDLRA